MTRKPRLLIVDDELDVLFDAGEETRRSTYQKLGDEFDIQFLEGPGGLHAALEKRDFDALLVDFVLSEWRMDARDIVREVCDSAPVVLISKSWSTNFDSLSATITAFPIARLFTWDDLTTPNTREIVTFWINAAIRSRHGNPSISIGPDETIRIVQFSDMQFDSDNPKLYKTDTEIAVQAIQSYWADPPQFLALPGDIAEAGMPSEYQMALDWTENLRKRLGQGRFEAELLTAPGNHDVCWPLALAQRVDAPNRTLTAGPSGRPELNVFAFAPFREFSSSVEPKSRWGEPRHFWVSGDYRQSGIILFGMNSSADLNDWGVPTRKLSDDTMSGLFSELSDLKRKSPNALVIGLMHHPLDQGPQCIVNAAEFKRGINETIGPIVLLTGHIHEEVTSLTANANRPGILQVGSSSFTLVSGKRPEDSLRGFNLIELLRVGNEVVRIHVHTYAIIGHQLRALSTSQYRHGGGRIADG